MPQIKLDIFPMRFSIQDKRVIEAIRKALRKEYDGKLPSRAEAYRASARALHASLGL